MVWEMEPAGRKHDQCTHNQNVFVRLWNLPSVSTTFEVIGGAYSSTKAANPLLSSVCEVCEQGMRSAGSLAVQSMQPAMHLLQPQLVAANSLACRGLDRLEEKMPAMEYPAGKLAAGIADLVSSAVRSPVVQYVLASKMSRLAEQGADTALTLTENLVNYILPASSKEKEEEVSQARETDVSTAGPRPGLARLGVLASTVCRRAYRQTAAQLQRTRSQGQQLVKCIPSLTLMQSSKTTDVIINTDGKGEKAEKTKSPLHDSPALQSNEVDQRNGPSNNTQEDSLKDEGPMESQPSEEHHPVHTKQVLETPEPLSES